MVKSAENRKIKKEPSKALVSISSTSDSKKKYKGVRMRRWGSWVSEIRAPNQKTRIWLGSYSNPEAAARAYDAALLCLKGSSATNLNFPSSSHYYIPPQDNVTMSPKSIQRIAAAAANTFINDNIATSSNTSTPPPSMASSPSPSSSFEAYNYDDQAMAMMEPWFGLEGLQSPKYVDHMFNGASYFDNDSSHLLNNNDLYVYEESDDIRLWDFC